MADRHELAERPVPPARQQLTKVLRSRTGELGVQEQRYAECPPMKLRAVVECLLEAGVEVNGQEIPQAVTSENTASVTVLMNSGVTSVEYISAKKP